MNEFKETLQKIVRLRGDVANLRLAAAEISRGLEANGAAIAALEATASAARAWQWRPASGAAGGASGGFPGVPLALRGVGAWHA